MAISGFKKKYGNVEWRQLNPPKYLPEDQVEALASLGCTYDDAALVLGVHPGTFTKDLQKHRELRAAWDRGQARGRTSLRMRRWQQAHMMNSAGVTMAIHLSRFMLGEHDKSEHRVEFDIVGKLLQEIDGTSRSIPESNQQMIDVTPEPGDANSIFDAVAKKDGEK